MPSAAPVMMRIKPAVSSSVAFARIFGPTIVNTVESAAKMTTMSILNLNGERYEISFLKLPLKSLAFSVGSALTCISSTVTTMTTSEYR